MIEENKEVYIIKANGERELFDSSKLENSLRKAGVEKKIIFQIIAKVEGSLRDGMETSEIYRNAFHLLSQRDITQASKYSLRRAVMGLGPQGFTFEDFIGAIFKKLGYRVLLRRHITGLCVSHEVDMIAQNDEKFLITEIKFHNKQGIKSDLKVVLYVKERCDDIAKGEFYRNIDKKLKIENWLITNTKFTSQAVKYAECSSDLNLMSWGYPANNNLHQLIVEAKLFPVTVLKSLSSSDKKKFLSENVVLCRDLLEGKEVLFGRMGISAEKTKEVLLEINELLK